MSEKIQDLEQRFSQFRGKERASTKYVDLASRILDKIRVDDPQRCIELCDMTLPVARKIGYKKGEGYLLAYRGFARFMLSDHENALPDLHAARSILSESGDEVGLARTMTALAGVYRSIGNFDMAFSSALDGLKLLQKTGDKFNEGWCLDGIGGGYHDIGDYEKSIQYHLQSQKVFESIGEVIGEARSLSGIGTVYQSMGDYELARLYHEKSLELFRRRKNRIGEARALNDLGLVCQAMGGMSQALAFHTESLKIRRQIGNRQSESTSLLNIGNVYLREGNTTTAISHLESALEIAQAIKVKPRIYQAYEALSKAYELEGNSGLALKYHRLFHRIKEEVFNEETASRLKNLQFSYEIEKTEREAEIVRLKNVVLEEKNEQLEQLLQELKVTQIQLIQSEKMASLGQLVAGVAHELNSPVGVIRSNTDLFIRSLDRIVEIVRQAESIDEFQKNSAFVKILSALQVNNSATKSASERISNIVNSLKNFARLDESSVQTVNIHEGLDSTLTLLEPQWKGRIEIVRDYGDFPHLRCHAGEMNQVFMQLLTNACQAIAKKGQISIHTCFEDDQIRVRITDTGCGIPPEKLQNLFDPGFTRLGPRVKSSLGLLTSYNIIQQHQGTIAAESSVGKGSTFTISIPARLHSIV